MPKQDRVFSRTPEQVERKAATKAGLKRAEQETEQLAEGWNLTVQNGHVESTIKLTIGGKTVNATIRFYGVLTDVVLDGYAKKEDLNGLVHETQLNDVLADYATKDNLAELVTRGEMESYVSAAIDDLRKELKPEEPPVEPDPEEPVEPDNPGDEPEAE